MARRPGSSASGTGAVVFAARTGVSTACFAELLFWPDLGADLDPNWDPGFNFV